MESRTRTVPVQPGGDGIVSVRHGLGTFRVAVRCLTVDGSPIGYRFHLGVTDQEIEVATVPGSGVVAVVVEAVGEENSASGLEKGRC